MSCGLRSWRRNVLLIGGAIPVIVAFADAAYADVTISTAATQNMSCTAGICSPTSTNAVLNASELQTMLASGNVTVSTTGSGVQADNIAVKAPFSWSSANALTLDAYDSIAVSGSVTVSGSGGLSLATNDGGSGGVLSFGLKGNVAFAGLSNALTINGTPYTLVGSIAALASAIEANPSGAYALAADYDAAGDGTYGAAPIPTALSGTVQGLGNTISSLSMTIGKGHHNKSTNFGLFAEVAGSGSVESLKMTGFDIRLDVGPDIAGGMVGLNSGSLFDDHTDGAMHTKAGGGGLVGANAGTIANSSSGARVSGPGGGLLWWNFDGAITQSYATGTVSGGRDAVVGGLVGFNASVVTDSYATDAVVGGSGATIGGMIGQDSGTFWSYSTGVVSAGPGSSAGGFAGFEESPDNEDCYWDTTTSGMSQGEGKGNETGVTGLTTAQLKSGLPSGFDPTIWAESPKINNGLPYLIGNPPN
ncbi:MAG: hypothetical protein ABSD74_17285 [Rhizomicrobium sp.]|jgi:hypothetical protein